MTEVVSPAQQLISVRRYEAAPVSANTELVSSIIIAYYNILLLLLFFVVFGGA